MRGKGRSQRNVSPAHRAAPRAGSGWMRSMEVEAPDDSEDVEIFEIRHLRFELDDQLEPKLGPHLWPSGAALLCCRDNITIEFSGINGESQFLLKSEAGQGDDGPPMAGHLWALAGVNEDSSEDQKIHKIKAESCEMDGTWPMCDAPLKTEASEDQKWTCWPPGATSKQDLAVIGDGGMEKAPPTTAASIMDDKSWLQVAPPKTEAFRGLKEDLLDIMSEFNLDFSRTVQCVFFNSGEVGSTRHFLRTSQRPDGCPIWGPKDDADLRRRKNPKVRARLLRKYGKENVARRATFLRS